MKKMGPGVKVRLTADLTSYHSSLKVGSIGTIVGRGYVPYSYGEDPWNVQFPAHFLPVFPRSLEIVEDDESRENPIAKTS